MWSHTHPELRGVRVGTIIVGVDGSESSQRALDFALREAHLRGATLHVVRASSLWSQMVVGADDPVPWPSAWGETFDDVRGGAEPELAGWVDAARNRTHIDDVIAHTETRAGDASDVLRAAAVGAELLVVGVRRRSDPTRKVMASVSRKVARNPTCPVVIVPDADLTRNGAR
jgi:nucleotide-binding universal stress UspA family protein